MNEKPVKRQSLKKKILVNAHLTMIIILLITFFSYYYIFRIEFVRNFQHRLTTLAQTASLMIDPSGHGKLKNPADEKTAEYRDIKAVLQKFKKANPDIRYIYTMTKTDKPDVWQFVVDAETGEDMSHLGDTYDVSGMSEMKRAFEGPIADKEVESDEWGSFLSGYAPIRDKTGQAVAIVGVDISADTLIEHERQMMGGALIIFLVSMALITYTTRKTVNHFLVPINIIMDGITKIKGHDLDYKVDTGTNDEFAEIGDMLNETSAIMKDYQRVLERNLEIAREQKEKIFVVYRDVIYSVTQGKFNLLNQEESMPIAETGLLCGELDIRTPEDVAEARRMVAEFLKKRGFPGQRIMHISLCVSEAATNAVKHARKGKVQIRDVEGNIRVIVLDRGPGMEFDKLPNMIFLEGFSTKISMGYGFSIIYRFADKIHLFTSEDGTFLSVDFSVTNEDEQIA